MRPPPPLFIGSHSISSRAIPHNVSYGAPIQSLSGPGASSLARSSRPCGMATGCPCPKNRTSGDGGRHPRLIRHSPQMGQTLVNRQPVASVFSVFSCRRGHHSTLDPVADIIRRGCPEAAVPREDGHFSRAVFFQFKMLIHWIFTWRVDRLGARSTLPAFDTRTGLQVWPNHECPANSKPANCEVRKPKATRGPARSAPA